MQDVSHQTCQENSLTFKKTGVRFGFSVELQLHCTSCGLVHKKLSPHQDLVLQILPRQGLPCITVHYTKYSRCASRKCCKSGVYERMKDLKLLKT